VATNAACAAVGADAVVVVVARLLDEVAGAAFEPDELEHAVASTRTVVTAASDTTRTRRGRPSVVRAVRVGAGEVMRQSRSSGRSADRTDGRRRTDGRGNTGGAQAPTDRDHFIH
jgi:hypothetical protein